MGAQHRHELERRVGAAQREDPLYGQALHQGAGDRRVGGWWGKLRDPFADEFAENLRQTVADEAARSGGDPWCIGWFVDNELSWGDDDLEVGRAVLRSPATQPAKIAAVKLFERKCGSIDALNRAWGADYGSWDDLLAASVTNAPDKFLAFVHRLVVARYYRSVREAVKAAAPA